MKVYGYVLVMLVLSTGVAAVGQAAQGQAPKRGGLPGASGKAGVQGSKGDQVSASINGTALGAGNVSVDGTRIRVSHASTSINGTAIRVWH